MKRILILFTFFAFTIYAHAQQMDTIKNVSWQNGNTITTGITLIIPHQSTSASPVQSVNGKTGSVIITANDLGVDATRDINKPISGPVQNAFNNLQNIFALKGTTGTGVSFPANINLPNNQWLLTITPTNYGKVYSNNTTQGRFFMGGYRDNIGTATNPINFSTTDREDKVFTIAAYNILTPNGSREFTNEAAWDETVETHYDNSGPTPYGDFEWHQRVYPTANSELRNSWYVNKTNGQSRRDWSANLTQWQLPSQPFSQPYTYAYLQEASMNVQTAQAGRVVGFWGIDTYNKVEVGIKEVGGAGFLKVPNLADGDGYGNLKLFLPNISSTSKPGQLYYKTITVNGETFDVLIRK